ncbi:hypothetical protein [Pseudomonas sp. Marseille-QA0892]
MNAPLRVNEALLIADSAFQPLQCIVWAPLDNAKEFSLSVIDRTSSALVERRHLTSDELSDPERLKAELTEARKALRKEGFHLAPWQMPH